MMAVIGWFVTCLVSGFFGLGALYWAAIAIFFQAREQLVLFVIFGLISAGFGYVAWANSPFKIVMEIHNENPTPSH